MKAPPFLVALAALLAVPLLHAETPARRPNIVFILADDLGIGELGCYGQQKIRTPNIDLLAAEGMRWTNFYSGSAVCAPSRCTFLTGLHTGHSAVRDNLERKGKEGQQPMPRETVTVAQLLQKAGYTTGLIGKWGLGMPEDQSGPNDFGFDYAYGYLCQRVAHTYYPDHLWRNGVSETLEGNPAGPMPVTGPWKIEPAGKQFSHDLMAEDALKFVREHKEKPFFLYLAYTIPHFSLQVQEEALTGYDFPEVPYEDKHYATQPRPRAAYAGMITRLDRDIGRLMDELKKTGLDDHTLVIFTSDNGVTFLAADTLANFFGSAAGLRGRKGDLYEGGIRTPFIARWPSHVPKGAVEPALGAFWDMLPTFCELAGVPAPKCDGVSLADTLLARATKATRKHPPLYWEYHSGGTSQAVRFDQWKGIRVGLKKNPDAPVLLYDLENDPAETTDVASQHSEVVARVKEVMATRMVSAVAGWNF